LSGTEDKRTSLFVRSVRLTQLRFIRLRPVANVIKLFTAVSNKLERLSLASLSSLV